jgi:hypothetical protein
MLAIYGETLARAFGWPGLAFATAGSLVALRDWRRGAALVALPVVTVAVFATAGVKHDRFLLVATPAVATLAGSALAWIARRSAAAGVLALAGLAAMPLSAAVGYVSEIRKPSTRDEIVDAAHSSLPPGARVLTTLPDLGFDRSRLEVGDLRNPAQAPYWDALVALDTEEWRAGFDVLHVAAPRSVYSGPRLFLLAPTDRLRPRLRSLDLGSALFTASHQVSELALLRDGDPATHWATPSPQAGDEWIRVELLAEAPIVRVELVQGTRPDAFAAEIEIRVGRPGEAPRPVRAFEGRAALEEQDRRGRSRVLILADATPTIAIELRQIGRRRRPWAVAELRLDAVEPGATMGGR